MKLTSSKNEKSGLKTASFILYKYQPYCWQVAPQQSLLPLQVDNSNYSKINHNYQLFLSTLPDLSVVFEPCIKLVLAY